MAGGIRVDTRELEQFQETLDDLFDETIDRQTARNLGRITVETMKASIARGVSTIKGKGRFPAYKNPAKYPGDRKPSRPVNLRLSGDFLNSLKSKVVTDPFTGFAAEVGFTEKKSIDKERGHRDGANSQPKRPIIPEGTEQFSKRIEDAVANILERRLQKLLDDL